MMTKREFVKELPRLRALLYAEGVQWDVNKINQFTKMSSNLLHFFPHLNYDAHQKTYSEALLHHWMNAMDIRFFSDYYPWNIRGWKSFLTRIKVQRGMIYTFHFGAYQLINYLLLKAKEPFALLVGDKVYQDWGKRNSGLESLLQEASHKGRFVLLNANDRASLRSMYNLSQKGFHLLVYIDGLEGINGDNGHVLEKISFLGREVEVPRGAVNLTYSLKLPIYAMIAVRQNDHIRIDSLPAILTVAHHNRALFTRKVLYRLYDWFESYVQSSPEQWTNWPYLQEIRPELQVQSSQLCSLEVDSYSDPMRYGLFYGDDESCRLVRKEDMMTFTIPSHEIELLRKQWYGLNHSWTKSESFVY